MMDGNGTRSSRLLPNRYPMRSLALLLVALCASAAEPTEIMAKLGNTLVGSVALKYPKVNGANYGVDYVFFSKGRRYELHCDELTGGGLTFYQYLVDKTKEGVVHDGEIYSYAQAVTYAYVKKVAPKYSAGQDRLIITARITGTDHYAQIQCLTDDHEEALNVLDGCIKAVVSESIIYVKVQHAAQGNAANPP